MWDVRREAIAYVDSVTPIRIQLVCDHQMLADALTLRLTSGPDEFVVSHRRSGDVRLLDAVSAHRPDIVVIDARSVAGHWSALVDIIAKSAPRARVTVLSGTAEAEDAVLAARRCVSAWLQPQVTADHLIDVLRVVADGHTVYPSVVLGAVLRRFADDLRDSNTGSGPLATLGDREQDVLACLVEGWSSREIAVHLDVASNTVRTHTNRIFRKLGVHSRLEAVRIARQCGFELCTSGRGSQLGADGAPHHP